MTDPVQAMREFNEAIQRTVDAEGRRAAGVLALRHRSRVRSIGWLEHNNGDAELVIELHDDHVYRERGGGKLDVLAALEARLVIG